MDEEQNVETQKQEQQPENLTDKEGTPIQAQDSESIATGKADAIELEQETIAFNEGNYSIFESLPQAIETTVQALTKTFIPLVEVALIELTGASSQYQRTSASFTPSFDQNGKLHVTFSLIYTVPGYIGVDFEYEDLQADSQYIFNRIKPAGIQISKCEIDTSNGDITINGQI